eukprot:9735093-Karenia_brevis.AAC.1
MCGHTGDHTVLTHGTGRVWNLRTQSGRRQEPSNAPSDIPAVQLVLAPSPRHMRHDCIFHRCCPTRTQ